MKRIGFCAAAFCGVALIGLIGCTAAVDTSDEALFPPSNVGAVEIELKPVQAAEFATLAGTVTLDGSVPERSLFPQLTGASPHNDAQHCMKGGPEQTTDPTWIVDPSSKGVANVVVWVEPPKNMFFPKPAQKTWADEVVVDQPFCAFTPHVVTLYPESYDAAAKKYVETGQKLVVKNSAPILHNFRFKGRDNPGGSGNIQPNGGRVEYAKLRRDRSEISFNCDVHKWMTGYAMSFDHPFAAVTDKNGKFEIKNVPAGAELTIKAWHESRSKPAPVDGSTKITLKGNETKTVDFKISAGK